MQKILILLCALTVIACVCAQASEPITLTDPWGENSVVKIDAYSDMGLYDWLVEGNDQATQGWYWYRIGNSGPAYAINTISDPTIDWSPDSPFMATITYSNSQLEFQLTYVLTGGYTGDGFSDVSETVTMKNNSSSSPLDLHVFEYTNFDLDGTSDNDTAWREDNTHITQQHGNITTNEGQVGVNPTTSHWEIGTNGSLLDKLRNGTFQNLSDTASPVTGDTEYAFQWDFNIATNGSMSISKDKLINGAQAATPVPEPSCLFVLGAGLSSILAVTRRKR